MLKGTDQPGEFAAEETVSLIGPKGTIERVRVIGPVRGRTQVEISGTDEANAAGVPADSVGQILIPLMAV